MYSENNDVSAIDLQKIRLSLVMHTPIEITTYTLPRNMEMYMQEILAKFLSVSNQDEMTEYLSFSLGELLTNSKKANTKRVYFKEKGLDINNEADYEVGMKTFRDDTFSNINHYLELQKKEGLYIKLIIKISNEFLTVEIRNNSKLTIFEEKRIQEKLRSVHKYNSVEEVLTEVLDQTEGSGLGIIIMILMLQKVGLSENNYQIVSTDTETITRIVLPMRGESKEVYLAMGRKLFEIKQNLPIFKDVFGAIQGMLNAPVDNKGPILNVISKDQSLTLFLLREANKKQKCINLAQAYDLIGVENLKKIFVPTNPELHLIDRDENAMRVWGRSLFCAFICFNIAANYYKNVNPEEAYLYGLLLDFTSLMYFLVNPDEEKLLKSAANNSEKTEKHYQAFIHGAFHERTEMTFLNTWGFPEKAGKVALYHHDYEHAPDDIREIDEILSLASLICVYKVKMIDFYQIDESLLKKCGIDSQEKLDVLLMKLDEEFAKFAPRPQPPKA